MSKSNVSNIFRILLGCIFGLCCAIFSVPVSAAYTWDDAHTDLRALKRDVDRYYNDMVRRSRGVTVTQNGNIVGSVGPNNTMQANTPVRYSSPKLSANSSSILRYGTDTVKRGAAACLKAPVRCNLVGLGVGFGINALLESIDAVIDGDDVVAPDLSPDSLQANKVSVYDYSTSPGRFTCNHQTSASCLDPYPRNGDIVVYQSPLLKLDCYLTRTSGGVRYNFVGVVAGTQGTCAYVSSEPDLSRYNRPLTGEDIDSLADNFELTDSDLPTVGTVVMSFEPTTIELSPTEPQKVADWSHFNNDGTYSELDLSAYFGVGDSPSSSPSVEYVEETTKKDFDENSNLLNEETTIERDSAVPNTAQPSSPAIELDIPTDCDLFDPFCKWADWTQQDLDEEEPDLSVLINEFEPENDGYTLDLGNAVCPAPISINVGFLNTDLELSYEPACDLMTMIRPLILASAYLLAAYIYLGVLRG